MAAISLRGFFETVYFPRRLAGRSQATVSDYRSCIATLERFWNRRLSEQMAESRPLDLGDLSDDLLAGAMAALVMGKRANGTANKLLRSIRAIWSMAVKDGHLARLTHCTPYPVVKREPVCWSLEEVGLILEAAAGLPGQVGEVPARYWWPALLLLAYNCGGRIDAIMATPSDATHLDLEAGWILIPGDKQKQKSDQRFDLFPETVAALRLIEPQQYLTIFGAWIFDRRGRGWRALTRGLRRILKRAGLPSTKRDLFHRFRRTTLTFVAAESDEATAQQIGGHSAPSVTRGYIDKRYLKVTSLRDILPVPKVHSGPRLFDPDKPGREAV